MRELLLSGIETAVNTYLRLDPDTLSRCNALNQAIIKISITDWRISFFIVSQPDGLQFLTHCKDTPNVCISGTVWGLFKTGYARGATATLFENNIEVTGDTHIAENVHRLLSQINIDWEEQLSKSTGDIIAHKIGFTVRRVCTAGRRAFKIAGENSTEYLQRESNSLPELHELKQFMTDVIKLQQDVERAEARLHRLNT